MQFHVKRLLVDYEHVFKVGKVYLAEITEMDFEYKGVRDQMNVWLKSESVDMEGMWTAKEFAHEFQIVHAEFNHPKGKDYVQDVQRIYPPSKPNGRDQTGWRIY